MRNLEGRQDVPVSHQTDLMILTTHGRYSDESESVILAYKKDETDFIVFAKNEGVAKPEWYLNLKEEPVVRIEAEGEVFHGRAETPTGAARLKLLSVLEEMLPEDAMTIPRNTSVIRITPIDRF